MESLWARTETAAKLCSNLPRFGAASTLFSMPCTLAESMTEERNKEPSSRIHGPDTRHNRLPQQGVQGQVKSPSTKELIGRPIN